MKNNKTKSTPEKTPKATTPAPTPMDTDSRVAEGIWGGPHVRLEVTASGANIEFDCAHGTLNGPLILRKGGFTSSGTFVREGGPTRLDEKGKTAYFKGQVEGTRMTLTLSLAEDGSEVGTYTLTHGVEVRLFKCK